jgi:aspartate/methionine/tyrosine aminotransferase
MATSPDAVSTEESKFNLSTRAQYLLSTPAHPYQWNHIKATFNQYDAETNPTGELPLAIAENKLSNDLLLPRLKQAAASALTEECLSYTDGTGAPGLKAAITDFLSKFVFVNKSGNNAESSAAPYTIQPANLVVSGGCTALLYKLSVLMFEPGDSVLIPSPYYSAFGRDFANLGDVHVLPVVPADSPWGSPAALSAADLDRAHAQALAAGRPPRALLISNPHNPLGVIYSATQLRLLLEWTQRRGLHFIVDEIYALSVFTQAGADSDAGAEAGGESESESVRPTEFTSVVSMLGNALPEHVHVLWGLSKDFGGSGLRLGVLYSQNQRLLAAVGAIDAFQVSRAVQQMVAHVLADHAFCALFIRENAARVRRAYGVLAAGLAAVGVPVVGPPVAATFAFVDFRGFIARWDRFRRPGGNSMVGTGDDLVISEELELAFYNEVLCDLLKVLFTPSDPCGLQTADGTRVFGYYRICYTWVQPDGLRECCDRLLAESLRYGDCV